MCRVFTLNLISQEADQGCLRKLLLITGKQEAIGDQYEERRGVGGDQKTGVS